MIRALVLSFAMALVANGAVVYSNTTTDLGLQDVFADSGATEIGDQVLLAPGPRQLQSITAALVSYEPDIITADVILSIYSADAVPVLLGSSTLTGVTFPLVTRTLLTFTGWSLTLPDELIWTIGFGGGASPVLGVEVYSPPTTGSSDAAFVWWRTGGTLATQSFSGIDNNYFLEIDASDSTSIPEAGTFGAVLAGGCILALIRRFRG